MFGRLRITPEQGPARPWTHCADLNLAAKLCDLHMGNPIRNLRSTLIRYGMGALLPGVALVLAMLLWPVIKPFAMPLFLTAIVISAWQGGKGPGLLATLLSGLIIDYVFITPQYQTVST